jgi:hypothetical protein
MPPFRPEMANHVPYLSQPLKPVVLPSAVARDASCAGSHSGFKFQENRILAAAAAMIRASVARQFEFNESQTTYLIPSRRNIPPMSLNQF